jgi:glycine dehydrogenase
MVTKPLDAAMSLESLQQNDDFIHRHIGPNQADIDQMLEIVGASSLDDLMDSTVPASILLDEDLRLPEPNSEPSTLDRLREYAEENRVQKSMIGMGYYETHVPQVIARNVLENPGWYTAYTPYQAEISQGRLESLLTFQQMVMDLTGMEMANASLLDEATAAAEAMTLCKRAGKKNPSNLFFVADDVHPQTIDVVQTRARYFGFEIVSGPAEELASHEVFGALLQYPGTTGQVRDLSPLIEAAHAKGALVAVATDLLSLALLKPPGEMGADIVLGSAQRFGVPMGFGGPHAAFFATRDEYKRSAPGRIIGVSRDRRGKLALRMAMQTREQHIRRDKATSNICTAQALLANMSAFYAVYHGPAGIKTIAQRVHNYAQVVAAKLADLGFSSEHEHFFDTLLINTEQAGEIFDRAAELGLNLRRMENGLGISFDETTTMEDVNCLLHAFAGDNEVIEVGGDVSCGSPEIPQGLRRTSQFLTHEVFNSYHCETEMLRYLKRLENKDFSLVHGMIPLGSCTMKLNATTEMVPVSWPEFSSIHPFAPRDQWIGYEAMINELRDWLIEITGYDAMSMQPNSGAQGEYAGLLAIRRYQESIGQPQRDICLIPSSAHGTNPASASMMGLKVVVVATDENGNIDLEDLKSKSKEHADRLSSLMITYPSTHGVFEETVKEACEIVHAHGGQVYMDGANMNALMGIAAPGKIGSDVSHLNLHKTFCIPHGGGGPGMGPIGVKRHLAPFLPNHVVQPSDGLDASDNGAVSAAPFGSSSILPISWAYIYMMGGAGLKKATQVAILNANYIATRLEGSYEVLYKGRNDRVAHECIVDIRPIKQSSGISEVDIAKRLMDYGFHAPTMSWPVPGTIMIEPTESESKAELDRFCDALLSIREEIRAVEIGEVASEASLPHQAPHTLDDVMDENWDRPYTRKEAAFPSPATRRAKFWPTVNRIDDVYGDRNFVCSCPPLSAYESTDDESDS